MNNLIIRPHGIGDIIMLIPALRGLVKNNPEEKFTLLVYKGSGQVLPSDLNINIIEMPRHAGFWETIKLLKEIRHQHFDRLFDLFCNPRTAQISLLSGIKERYGFPCRYRSFAYNHKFTADRKPGEHIHQVDLYSKFFNTFGLKCEVCPPDVKMSEEIIAKAKAAIPTQFAQTKPLIAVNPNPNPIFPTRSWPEENIVRFIELWYTKTNTPVMLTWGPGEEAASKSIIEKVGNNKAFMHAPLKLNEFAALLSQLDLFISGDCGPLHIAWGTGKPAIISMFGPTTEQDVEPRGEKCITIRAEGIECARCHKEHCATKKCMYAITPEMVLTNIQKILNQ